MVKRIRVSNTDTTVVDDFERVRVFRAITASSGGTTGTAIKLRPDSPASVCTVKVKNGTTAFTPGSNGNEYFDQTYLCRQMFEWVARDGEDYITSDDGGIFSIFVSAGPSSQDITVECDWEE